MIPGPAQLTDLTLFLLRVVLALMFLSSGWSHARRPDERAESIGMPVWFTASLGVVEMAAGASLVLGLYPRIASLLIVGIMLGAIYKKMFVWTSGFFGADGGGWYYDLFYLVAALVIAATGGGAWTLT